MPRVDIWDVPDSHDLEPIWCGYKRNINAEYELDRPLGEGGFGSVRVVRKRSNGAEFACKSICKRLDVPNLPPIKQQQHIDNVRREVLILRKLRGTLNVVHLVAVYEDETHVHIVMEYCRGGELLHRMGKRHYSERTVASYMRAVLRTLAQCHAHRILHRDIKPGNFMLLTEAEDAPLKAIDFGLAVLYDPAKLPLTDLGLEGTPWYMAPEVLSSAVEPASDVWAAGVMAYQLLCGRFPFDDRNNPQAPALSMVWRSIISEEPSFTRSGWQDISQPAKDFCKALLNKDPRSRPTAREALEHPWLRKGNARQRLQGTQLNQVVQRLQRYNQQNVFKKTVLDMMANELLSRHMARIKQAEEDEVAGAAAAAAAVQDQGGSLPSTAAAAAGGGSEQQQEELPQHRTSDDGQPVGSLSRRLSGEDLLRSIQQHPQGSPIQPAAAAAVQLPQYLEGSVHRQQQLLRLIPPKRSLDLSPPVETQAIKVQRPSSSNLPDGSPLTAGAQAHQGPGIQRSASKLLLAAAAARLEGSRHGLDRSFHGPLEGSLRGYAAFAGGSVRGGNIGGQIGQGAGGSGAATRQHDEQQQHGDGGLDREGSVHMLQRIGSVKGATSALEALRRARERKVYGEGLEGSVRRSSEHQHQQQQQGLDGQQRDSSPTPTPAAAAAAATAQTTAAADGSSSHSPVSAVRQRSGGLPAAAAAADSSYKGPVRDSSFHSLWDLQFMANRLAMEGSAHGNAFAHRLLQAASTHAGALSPSTAMQNAATRLSQQQQQRRLSGDSQLGASPQQWQQQSPQRSAFNIPAAAKAKPERASSESLRSGSLSSLDHNMWLEGTWHGPGAAAAADQLMQRISALDRSWHGRTDFASKQARVAAASKRAAEDRAEFLRFLEAAKRQRHEQRKVARLVLEGSTHGGSSGLSKYLITRIGGPGTDVDEDAWDGDRTDAIQTDSSRPAKSILNRLGRSMKSILARHKSQDTAAGSDSSGDGMKHVDSVNELARTSYLPSVTSDSAPAGINAAASSDKPTFAAGAAAETVAVPKAGAAVMPPASGGTSTSDGGVAQQILELQSPGWQASLESRRRGHGAYAALMAATSIVQGDAAAAAPAMDSQTPTAAASAKITPGAVPDIVEAGEIGASSKVKPLWAETIEGVTPKALASKPQPNLSVQVQELQQQHQEPQKANEPQQQQQDDHQQQQHQQQQEPQQPQQAEEQQQQQHLDGPQPQQMQPLTGHNLLPSPSTALQHSLLPTPGGSRFGRQPPRSPAASSPIGSNPPWQQQHQQRPHGHQLLLVPKPWQLPQVPEEPEPQQQQQQQGVGRQGSTHLQAPGPLLPSPAASDLHQDSRSGGTSEDVKPQAAAAATAPAPPAAAHDLALSAPQRQPAAATAAEPTPLEQQQDQITSGSNLATAAAEVDQSPIAALDQIQELLDLLQYDQHEVLTVEQLQLGLANLGYALEASEVLEIARDLGYGVEGSDGVAVSQFAASQLDWEQLQINHREEWLECVRSAFNVLDTDKDGRIKPAEILEALKAKLPEAEVNAAIEDVLLEAAADEDEGLDLAAFSLLASVPATDSVVALDQYDARLPVAGDSVRSRDDAQQALAAR